MDLVEHGLDCAESSRPLLSPRSPRSPRLSAAALAVAALGAVRLVPPAHLVRRELDVPVDARDAHRVLGAEPAVLARDALRPPRRRHSLRVGDGVCCDGVSGGTCCLDPPQWRLGRTWCTAQGLKGQSERKHQRQGRYRAARSAHEPSS